MSLSDNKFSEYKNNYNAFNASNTTSYAPEQANIPNAISPDNYFIPQSEVIDPSIPNSDFANSPYLAEEDKAINKKQEDLKDTKDTDKNPHSSNDTKIEQDSLLSLSGGLKVFWTVKILSYSYLAVVHSTGIFFKHVLVIILSLISGFIFTFPILNSLLITPHTKRIDLILSEKDKSIHMQNMEKLSLKERIKLLPRILKFASLANVISLLSICFTMLMVCLIMPNIAIAIKSTFTNLFDSNLEVYRSNFFTLSAKNNLTACFIYWLALVTVIIFTIGIKESFKNIVSVSVPTPNIIYITQNILKKITANLMQIFCFSIAAVYFIYIINWLVSLGYIHLDFYLVNDLNDYKGLPQYFSISNLRKISLLINFSAISYAISIITDKLCYSEKVSY